MIEMGKADQVIVFDGMEHLRQAFNAFSQSYHKPMSGLDRLMISHNFHKLVIQHIAEEMPAAYRTTIFEIADATWTKAMQELKREVTMSKGELDEHEL